jgi:hypothetical protein
MPPAQKSSFAGYAATHFPTTGESEMQQFVIARELLGR